MSGTNCLRCEQSMEGRFFSICPRCGRYMATRTPGEIVLVYSVSVAVAVVGVGGLTVLLWMFA
jgi:hypothetical protein